MKTSGVSCETKFGLLVFLGHPTVPSATNCSLFAGTFSFQDKTFDAESKSSAKITVRSSKLWKF